MPTISNKVSYGLDDFFILTGWTPKEATYDKVDLTTRLAPNVVLRYPFIAAAMSCVTGYEMALACAKNGIMAVVPCSIPTEEQVNIVKRVKGQEVRKGQIEFVDDPVWIRDDSLVGHAVERYNEHGHSVIPICDDFRTLRGVFKYDEGIRGRFLGLTLREALEKAKKNEKFREIFIPFDMQSAECGRDYCMSTEETGKVHEKMKSGDMKYLPIVDDRGQLKRLAFIYKYYGYMVGGAIHTHTGWENRVEKLLDAGTDMIFIDSSHGKTDFQVNVLKEYKSKFTGVPICAGNIIDADGYNRLVDAGADLVKCGLGSGGSCITTEGRGPGRGMLTLLKEIYEERERAGENTPIIADGGIGARVVEKRRVETLDGKKYLKIIRHYPGSINKALAFADGVMLGTSLNVCKEAAGDDFEYEGIPYKGRWGEGSLKAAGLARYGVDETVRRAFIEEGISDYVTCGMEPKPGTPRLKHVIEKTALNIKMTFSNVGAITPKEYRDNCVLELVSGAAKKAAGTD